MLYARRSLDTAICRVEGNRRTAATTPAVRSVFAPAQIRLRNGLTVVALLDGTGALSVLAAESAALPL